MSQELFVITIDVGPVAEVGKAAFGVRRFVPAAAGTVAGAVNGELLPGGGDWLLAGDDGYARADIRYVVKAEDGALLYTTGEGLIELNDTTLGALSGRGPSDYDDHYVRVRFTFETADERYAWLSTALFIGKGRFLDGAIQYSVSRVD